jgi:predicted unusual protein kinase regulating ubiquinone biosynthesis (AarF/ABC1/UbiB family)
MVKPIAMKMFNIKKEGSESYFQEVEDKLFEETDYNLELKRSQHFAEECSHLPNVKFPIIIRNIRVRKSLRWIGCREFIFRNLPKNRILRKI